MGSRISFEGTTDRQALLLDGNRLQTEGFQACHDMPKLREFHVALASAESVTPDPSAHPSNREIRRSLFRRSDVRSRRSWNLWKLPIHSLGLDACTHGSRSRIWALAATSCQVLCNAMKTAGQKCALRLQGGVWGVWGCTGLSCRSFQEHSPACSISRHVLAFVLV